MAQDSQPTSQNCFLHNSLGFLTFRLILLLYSFPYVFPCSFVSCIYVDCARKELHENNILVFFQITVLFMFACLFAAGLYGSMKVEEGLDLTDVVPRKSPEHKFVEAQFKYFSFYQIAGVTMEGYDYPNGQELLYEFHNAFQKVKLCIPIIELNYILISFVSSQLSHLCLVFTPPFQKNI